MDAITNLVATVALLLAMAAAGGASKSQVEVSSPSATVGASSRPLPGGCHEQEWICGVNHNETLLRDVAQMR